MRFINTRPADRAEPLTQQLQQLGHEVLQLPLLVLKPIALHDHLRSQLMRLNQAQIVVVVSPTAAYLGLQYLQVLNIPVATLTQLKWIAVGEKTAKVLAVAGIDACVPTVETSEGMLQLPLLQQSGLNMVAFWRGEGGRQFMMEQLRAQGVQIFNMLLYQRALPQDALMHAHSISQQLHQEVNQQTFVCISSEASWKNWQYLCAQQNWSLSHFTYLPLGQRLADLLSTDLTHIATTIYPIFDLKPATIHTAMVQGQRT
ncbi:uroporphyrinogen-III synthase [Acinetobacter sp. B10A]|uniref:uroporphyrinogen-III synthase n=1 Tax=Acinetobacter baretiae TaxID=2605383 RepID=UPI001B3C84D0|nr:uroporphyrinogen-III synthase [Acinetobacter baretiae]MBF7685339.1 uroporphyrinogen-III synthase [Acinetobacter baretiae]